MYIWLMFSRRFKSMFLKRLKLKNDDIISYAKVTIVQEMCTYFTTLFLHITAISAI